MQVTHIARLVQLSLKRHLKCMYCNWLNVCTDGAHTLEVLQCMVERRRGTPVILYQQDCTNHLCTHDVAILFLTS